MDGQLQPTRQQPLAAGWQTLPIEWKSDLFAFIHSFVSQH